MTCALIYHFYSFWLRVSRCTLRDLSIPSKPARTANGRPYRGQAWKPAPTPRIPHLVSHIYFYVNLFPGKKIH